MWVVCLLCVPGGVMGQRVSIKDRSVSTTRQFVVYCEDRMVRNSVALLAEDVKRKFLHELRLKDNWKHPIVVQIVRPGADGTSRLGMRLYQTEEGLKFQVDVEFGEDLENDALREELLAALMSELAYRNIDYVTIGGAVAQPPHWLVSGMSGIIGLRERKIPADVYKVILESNLMPQISTFLDENPQGKDTATRGVYRAHAISFVRTLLEIPSGGAQIVEYLQSMAADPKGDAKMLLIEKVPELEEGVEFQKLWALNIARLAITDRSEFMTVAESEVQLLRVLDADILMMKGEEELRYKLTDIETIAASPQGKMALTNLAATLRQTGLRVNPLQQPIVNEYLEILNIAIMPKGKLKGLQARILQTNALREQVRELGYDIEDHMNWMQATQVGRSSELFSGYFQAVKRFKREEPEKRVDPVTQYMDAMEEVMR